MLSHSYSVTLYYAFLLHYIKKNMENNWILLVMGEITLGVFDILPLEMYHTID